MSQNILQEQPEIPPRQTSGEVSHLISALQSTFQLPKAEKLTNKQQK